MGCPVAHLPGLTMRRIADLYPGEAKTDALDPGCGADVFLIAAARFLATAHAGVLYGTHQPAALRCDRRRISPSTRRG
ncbi:hypothetical protein ABZ723_33640 [Streptomyces sp. NPDC006700]|uniref:hypothetical protein n=1 Tax=Streptomyces sp. NPDC006700 TaxID=3154479 RepID=UPI0033FCED6C